MRDRRKRRVVERNKGEYWDRVLQLEQKRGRSSVLGKTACERFCRDGGCFNVRLRWRGEYKCWRWSVGAV